MSKKVKIICDDIEYKLEMQDDKTILELALENDIDAPYLSLIHISEPTRPY